MIKELTKEEAIQLLQDAGPWLPDGIYRIVEEDDGSLWGYTKTERVAKILDSTSNERIKELGSKLLDQIKNMPYTVRI